MNQNLNLEQFEVNLIELFNNSQDVKDTIWYNDNTTLVEAILIEVEELINFTKKEVFDDIEKLIRRLNYYSPNVRIYLEEIKKRHLSTFEHINKSGYDTVKEYDRFNTLLDNKINVIKQRK